MLADDYRRQADDVRAEGLALLATATTAEALRDIRDRLFARKSGLLTTLQQGLAQVDDKRAAGLAFNATKQALEAAFETASAAVAAQARGPAVDGSLPARRGWRGTTHPVSIVIDEIAEIFRELGFTIALGPEAEHEWYNFGALNFPADHPAMDMHDTLYLGETTVLRTHTSPVQVRTLQQYPPPVRVLAPGNVYRRDFFDATHAPAFAQIEGMAVDEGISFADLRATLNHFARRFYGASRRTRFGPSYFPFTEPSAQMDVEIDLGDGRGTRWVEILGCGLMHPAVLEAAGLDSSRYSGWAFGMGPARIAMARYGITDIRLLYDSDVRFLQQFS
ncbi:MAG: phenylalanine--tRNA ligase subunit alpha [Gemmatimonadaceae bacterium]|nr:phenylalanine--tRNA ligase subunit alpha [Gemmatimonadaceae bacterium]